MPKSIWDTATHIVFERGVTFRKTHSRWLCTTATQAVCNLTPLDFAQKTDFRAVYVEIPHPTRPLTYIIPQDGTGMLDMRVPELSERVPLERPSRTCLNAVIGFSDFPPD